jgi:hypothetical protein
LTLPATVYGAYSLGNSWGNSSCRVGSRGIGGGAGVIVSAVTWEGDITSTGALGAAGGACGVVVAVGSGIGPAATVGLEVGVKLV